MLKDVTLAALSRPADGEDEPLKSIRVDLPGWTYRFQHGLDGNSWLLVNGQKRTSLGCGLCSDIGNRPRIVLEQKLGLEIGQQGMMGLQYLKSLMR